MFLLAEPSFAELLGRYVSQGGYSYGQLARLSGLPKRTLAHWLEGIVTHPRDWRDLVKVAAALRLDEPDATRLLQAAKHASLPQLLSQAQAEADCALLAPWNESLQRRLEQAPFQAVADLPHFVGRERESAALQQALLAGKLCSLQGMAGAGKTALATRLAYQLRPHFPQGVLWARLDHSDSLSILSSFAHAYGVDVREYTDLETRSRAVRELLANKRTLLVLDNAETSEQVTPLLPPSGTCAVLVTTRRHDLAVARGAQRFQLGPFVRRADSLLLFAILLGEAYLEREKATLDELASLLGDLPLALDLAASRLAYEPGWSASDFLARMRSESGRLGELLYENQGTQMSFNISYQRLTAPQQHFFHTLGAFAGDDFTPEAAAYVADLLPAQSADHLRSLYALSLVQLGRTGRYRLHPLLRDLARKGLPSDEADRRMIDFFSQWALAQGENFPALDVELSNLLAALETSAARRLDPELVRCAGALSAYLDARGLYPQAEASLKQAIQSAERLNDPIVQADLLCKLGLVLLHAGQLEAAEQRLLAGLELIRQRESLGPIAALLLGYLGMAAYYRNDFAQMEIYLRESLALARNAGQETAVCQLLDGLSSVTQRRGDYAAAEACSREGLALARRLENPELICLLLKGLATVIFERSGDHAEFHACLDECLQLARGLGQPRVLCETLLTAGYFICLDGDYERAEACLQEAFQMLQQVDFPLLRVFVLSTLGLTALARCQYDRSTTYLTEGLTLARQSGVSVLLPPLLNAWGGLYLQQNQLDEAARAFGEALATARQGGHRAETAQALYGLAQVAAAQSDLPAARRFGVESLFILETIGHRTQAEVRIWVSELGPAQTISPK